MIMLPFYMWRNGNYLEKEEKSSPVVIDGIKGDGVLSVLCLGVAVVNGALIFMTVGRCKLCNRTLPKFVEWHVMTNGVG